MTKRICANCCYLETDGEVTFCAIQPLYTEIDVMDVACYNYNEK